MQNLQILFDQWTGLHHWNKKIVNYSIHNKIITYGSSGVKLRGSVTNCGSKLEGSRSESIRGLYGGVI